MLTVDHVPFYLITTRTKGFQKRFHCLACLEIIRYSFVAIRNRLSPFATAVHRYQANHVLKEKKSRLFAHQNPNQFLINAAYTAAIISSVA